LMTSSEILYFNSPIISVKDGEEQFCQDARTGQ